MKPLKLLILVKAANLRAEPQGIKAFERPVSFGLTKITAYSIPKTRALDLSLYTPLTISGGENKSYFKLKTLSVSEPHIVTSTVVPRVSVITRPTLSGTIQILPSTSSLHPEILGTSSIYSLDTFGQATQPPFTQIYIPDPTTTLSPVPVTMPTNSAQSILISQDIFQPVATSAPPNTFSTRSDHPIPRLGIKPQTQPLPTNKFYSNFFLGNQTARVWTHPYSLGWVKGGGKTKSWGMSITQVDADKKIFNPPNTNPAKVFENPINDLSIILSSTELKLSASLSIDSLNSMSANVNLHKNSEAPAQITFPVVQGMGFVTAIFNGGTPVLESGVFFRDFTKISAAPKPGVSKFKINLEDNTTWLMYAYSSSGSNLEFTVVSKELVQATSNFEGVIQISKNPPDNLSAEAIYDASCGTYAKSVDISGSIDGDFGSYTFTFVKGGLTDAQLVMFALPHHMSSFSPETLKRATDVQLETTTKGKATAIISDSWKMIEKLPTGIGFGPWRPNQKNALSPDTINAIHTVASSEISQNMTNQTNLDSIYFSGKALAKFASITYTLHEILGDASTAQAGLNMLKECFAIFTTNKNKYPLVYDSAWKGIVSSASYTSGDLGLDFGNTCYNDHHFHYGYFILTAALIGSIDPDWITTNKEYVNTLVRDIANPSSLDTYFPVSRNFDWYHGHSWAHGLFESSDGNDQESSSEDCMSAYALKMWGHVSGDLNIEARGNLQLAINARSIQSYYLYESDNKIQPANFIGNKVAGILFENKIDCTTYFGNNTEYIHGIHMIPLLPSSSIVRTQKFVHEEWEAFFSGGRINNVKDGWKSILYGNLALVDAKSAWNFFNAPDFNDSYLDGGSSRTWYMTFAAALGGSQ